MRRIAAFFLAACFAFLAGCSSGQKALTPRDLDLVFSCRLDVSASGGKYVCAFSRAGREDASVEILSGNGAGMKWSWNGDGFRQTYRGLCAESPACTLPGSSFASVLVEALDCAEQEGTLTSEQTNIFSGSTNGCAFTLEADGATGRPRTLSVPDWGLTVDFRDFAASGPG